MTGFFIPELRDDPAAAEAEWQRYLDETPAPAESRRLYKLTYVHNGDKYEVTVGEPRKQFRRQRGPRGGYIPNADYERYGRDTDTIVSGMIDAGDLIYVWSYGPPFGGWANPSMVGRAEIRNMEHFDDNQELPKRGLERVI